jgi:hypothetical protein
MDCETVVCECLVGLTFAQGVHLPNVAADGAVENTGIIVIERYYAMNQS